MTTRPRAPGNAPWYLRVSAGFVLLVGLAQFVDWFSSGSVRGSGGWPIAGAMLAIVGAAVIAGHRWAYPFIVLVAVIALGAGVFLIVGDQGVPPGNAVVGLPLATSGAIVLVTAGLPRSIRWARGRDESEPSGP
jgi:hypothetical protein